jgi:hypothetical protein
MQINKKESSIGRDTEPCFQCGAPLLGLEGIRAVVAAKQELYCKGYCIGQQRQKETIAFYHQPSRTHSGQTSRQPEG